MSKSIQFISKIKHSDDESEISFKAAVTIGTFEDFTTFEFVEPQNNMTNRIEVSDKKVNIFVGPSTIELELNKVISIQYQTPHGILYLDSHMSKLEMDNINNIKFDYSLSKEGEILGNYNITLKIE